MQRESLDLFETDTESMRTFSGGATRDLADGKLSYIRFLSPEVLTEYCRYLEKHRDTAAGRRAQDNWKSGIPRDVYMDSIGRHFWELWAAWEIGYIPRDALNALLFNVMGLMYEEIKGEKI